MKIRPVGVYFHSDGRTDMTKLIVAFLSFAKAPSNTGRLSEVLTKLILGA